MLQKSLLQFQRVSLISKGAFTQLLRLPHKQSEQSSTSGSRSLMLWAGAAALTFGAIGIAKNQMIQCEAPKKDTEELKPNEVWGRIEGL